MEHLILIHGAIGAADQMMPLQEILKDQFVIHILEFDGHGSTSNINDAYNSSKFISELEALINKIGKHVHIFGYSMGGFIALLAASKGNEQIKSITTLGTKMKWDPLIAEKEVKHLNPDKIQEKVPVFAKALERRHGRYWQEVLHRTSEFMKWLGIENPISSSSMSEIKIPVQLCLADQDNMVTEEETHEVESWITNARFQVIPNSKHPIEQTDLKQLSTYIESFIKSVSI